MQIKRMIIVAVVLMAVMLLTAAAAQARPSSEDDPRGPVATPPPEIEFIVNNDGDQPDANLSNGICETATSGVCTLRAAIMEANQQSSKIATIHFGGSVNWTTAIIYPTNAYPPDLALPPLTSNGTTIDGQGTLIRISGLSALPGTSGIELAGSSQKLHSLQITGFDYGVTIGAGVGNIVGTDADSTNDSQEKNILYFNEIGVLIAGGSNHRVAGNWIGLNSDGEGGGGNTTGVKISGSAHDCVIGNDDAGTNSRYERNVISGNTSEGILIEGVNSIDHVIADNYIGTNPAGDAAIGNHYGIVLQGSTSGNLVGTNGNGATDTSEGNLISGNQVGVQVTNSDNNTIAGNKIGTDRTGAVAVPNAAAGIVLSPGAEFNVVGTDGDDSPGDAYEGNLISGNTHVGLDVSADDNTVAGNLIGTDDTGLERLPNGDFGVLVQNSAQRALIGTDGDGTSDDLERNVISGNDGPGVTISSADYTTVAGNFIGVDKTGEDYCHNADDGVEIKTLATHNIVGTDGDGQGDAAEANVISGNQGYGVSISGDGTDDNRVAGNRIGSTLTDTPLILNQDGGVLISNDATGNIIGTDDLFGSDEDERNIISSNVAVGIRIDNASGNGIHGNYVGLNAAGTAELTNYGKGIELVSATGNYIGGIYAGQGNVVSGNTSWAIQLDNSSSGNFVNGNLVGTAADGVTNVGNGNEGIYISWASSNNVIGGLLAGSQNTIAYNAVRGVVVSSDCTGNSIEANNIWGNGGLGIDLWPVDGPNANDEGDGDGGANNGQNYPVLTAVDNDSGLVITGALNSNANSTYTLHFYVNSSCDPSGHGEGENYVGFLGSVSTDGSGDASFTKTIAGSYPAGFVTATATDPDGNTSEFSACFRFGTQSIYLPLVMNGS